MNKQRMIKMLKEAKAAILDAGLASATATRTEGEVMAEADNALIGQLILASAIEESGSSIGLSLDKLDKVAQEFGDIATAIGHLR